MLRGSTRLAIALLLVCGCSVGKNFVRPGTEDLVLGKTTLNEALERYGSPHRESEKLAKGLRVKALMYYFSQPQASGWAHHQDSIPERSLSLEFVEGRLVSYLFHSTFENDHTDFDDSKVDQVKKGETTLQTAFQWFGEPHGRTAYPKAEQESEVTTIYGYIRKQKSGNAVVLGAKKILILKSGANGVITDVSFSKSSTNNP